MDAPPRIRSATNEDAPGLPDIERSAGLRFLQIPALAWIAHDTVLSVAQHMACIRQGLCWVAVDTHDRPIGFLSAARADAALHIDQLAVRLGSQGRGIGTALMARAAEKARAWDLAAVTLTTFRGVPWNEPFYRRLGFETLDGQQLDQRLQALLEAEVRHGLPPDQRCAMRLALREDGASPSGKAP
jgi:GNAT superfamily N-acetyltransferase